MFTLTDLLLLDLVDARVHMHNETAVGGVARAEAARRLVLVAEAVLHQCMSDLLFLEAHPKAPDSHELTEAKSARCVHVEPLRPVLLVVRKRCQRARDSLAAPLASSHRSREKHRANGRWHL